MEKTWQAGAEAGDSSTVWAAEIEASRCMHVAMYLRPGTCNSFTSHVGLGAQRRTARICDAPHTARAFEGPQN